MIFLIVIGVMVASLVAGILIWEMIKDSKRYVQFKELRLETEEEQLQVEQDALTWEFLEEEQARMELEQGGHLNE